MIEIVKHEGVELEKGDFGLIESVGSGDTKFIGRVVLLIWEGRLVDLTDGNTWSDVPKNFVITKLPRGTVLKIT